MFNDLAIWKATVGINASTVEAMLSGPNSTHRKSETQNRPLDEGYVIRHGLKKLRVILKSRGIWQKPQVF
jgi:hypothetical protein